MPGRHVDTLGGVIEGPAELHFRRIRVHLAGYIRFLLLRHAVDLRLIRLARGRDCESGKSVVRLLINIIGILIEIGNRDANRNSARVFFTLPLETDRYAIYAIL